MWIVIYNVNGISSNNNHLPFCLSNYKTRCEFLVDLREPQVSYLIAYPGTFAPPESPPLLPGCQAKTQKEQHQKGWTWSQPTTKKA